MVRTNTTSQSSSIICCLESVLLKECLRGSLKWSDFKPRQKVNRDLKATRIGRHVEIVVVAISWSCSGIKPEVLSHSLVTGIYRPFRCESHLVQKSINTPIFRALLEGKGLPKAALLPKKYSDSRLDS